MDDDSGPAGHLRRRSSPGFGVYIHIPFCSRRCDYCAFATWDDRGELISSYMEALGAQIRSHVRDWEPGRVTSVFVGGGTPSLVPAGDLAGVLSLLPLAPDAEVSVECNPDDVTVESMRTLAGAGVERISLGVQSMVDHVLVGLGRSHTPDNVTAAVESVRTAGIERLNLDLIYGGAGETPADWNRTLDRALALEPSHVSAYALTVEAGTPLAEDPSRHPDDDDQADKYLMADEMLSAAGLANYEVSNWARPGEECRHNLLYWSQGEYQGFGCAAHSHLAGRRFWSVRTPERFIAAVTGGGGVEAGSETLDPEARELERLQLALRLSSGVPAETIPPEVRHLVTVKGGRAVLTREGRLMANEVAVRLEPHRAGSP